MIRPMLAFKKPKDWTDEQYLQHIESHLPLIVQPKLDGIRCIIDQDGLPRSRTWKLIPNHYIRQTIKEASLPYGLDGELLTYNTGHKLVDSFNTISSNVMSEEGVPAFLYNIFDIVDAFTYSSRLYTLNNFKDISCITLTQSHLCTTLEDIISWEKAFIDNDYEGLILRKPNSPYKQGRPTAREFYLAALKRFEQSEATIIGFEEKLTNLNPSIKSEQGFTDRSSHSSNMKGANTLGSLVVRDLKTNVEFNVGSGFDDLHRQHIWDNRIMHTDRIITYRYQANRSKKDKPISPTFVGFRSAIDI